MKKKIIILSTALLIVVGGGYLKLRDINKENKLISVETLQSKNLIGMYVEEGNEYTKTDTIPNAGYIFNSEKSYCKKGNEKLDVTINYNVNTKELSVTPVTLEETKCYLYFNVAWEGKGTAENPYKIKTIEDLVALSNAVNNGITYEDNYFRLENNLDFQNMESYIDNTNTSYGDINGNGKIEELKIELTTGSGFIPIGNSNYNDESRYFSGIFDGNNKKISNLYIYNEESDKAYLGLFGYAMNATIKNLGVDGIFQTNIRSDLGGIVGRGYNIAIENCYNESNITSKSSTYSTGGIIGWTQGTTTIKSSHNSGSISNGNNTGGLVGGEMKEF